MCEKNPNAIGKPRCCTRIGPCDFAPDPRQPKPVRVLVREQCMLLERQAIRPWYINFGADTWERALIEWDLISDGPVLSDPLTYMGLPVFIWAPGSYPVGSDGLTVHGYPAGAR